MRKIRKSRIPRVTRYVTLGNWQPTVLEAAAELGPRIKGLRLAGGTTEGFAAIMIARPDDNDSGEHTDLGRVEFKYWPSVRERGWPKEYNSMFAPGGQFFEILDWPLIGVFSNRSGNEDGIFLGRSDAADWKKKVKRTLLAEAAALGLVYEERNGRFYNTDGSLIGKFASEE
jgi:hypothetical protein